MGFHILWHGKLNFHWPVSRENAIVTSPSVCELLTESKSKRSGPNRWRSAFWSYSCRLSMIVVQNFLNLNYQVIPTELLMYDLEQSSLKKMFDPREIWISSSCHRCTVISRWDYIIKSTSWSIDSYPAANFQQCWRKPSSWFPIEIKWSVGYTSSMQDWKLLRTFWVRENILSSRYTSTDIEFEQVFDVSGAGCSWQLLFPLTSRIFWADIIVNIRC